MDLNVKQIILELVSLQHPKAMPYNLSSHYRCHLCNLSASSCCSGTLLRTTHIIHQLICMPSLGKSTLSITAQTGLRAEV